MDSHTITPDTELDSERLALLVNVFGKALASTPNDMPLIERGRAALRPFPLPFLQALGAAAGRLVDLVAERVDELTSEGSSSHAGTDSGPG